MKAKNRADHPVSLKRPDRKPSLEELMVRWMEDCSAETVVMAAILEARSP